MNKNIFSLLSLSMVVAIALNGCKHESTDGRTHSIDAALLDSAIHPGDDFFNYVNAKWISQNPIPATESKWGSFYILRDSSKHAVRQILENASKANAEKGSITQKVGDFYFAAMDTVAINKAGLTPIASYLEMIDKIQSRDDMIKAVAALHHNGANPMFQFRVDADEKNSMMNILAVGQAGLGLPDRDYYFRPDEKSESIRQAYRKYVGELFTLAGSDSSGSQSASDAVWNIETQLATASMTLVERRDPDLTYNKMTKEDFSSSAPQINWSLYFSELKFPAFNELIVAQPKFFTSLSDMLKSVSLDDWKTYLKFHFLNNVAELLSAPFEQVNFDFYKKTLEGVQEMDPRWKRVSSIANYCLNEAIGQEYVKMKFSSEAKEKTLELVNDLKAAFAIRIDKLDWMSDSTKALAKDKLSKITVKVGYPDNWKDYSYLEMDRGPYVLNVMRCLALETDRQIARTGLPVDKSLWLMSPQTVNAYYNPVNNEVVFPAAILQPPFFDPQADDAVNYGGIGAVIGHEITHGFDDQGGKYDAQGNLRDWWTMEDGKKFKEKAQGVADWYQTFQPVDTLHINGRLTLGENIADIGGLTIAFDAFEIHKSKIPQADTIDGFTPEQRFFLNYGQIWRGSYRDDAMRVQVLTNPHSPNKYRVLGVLSNIPQWYEAFNIQPDNAMYLAPEKRVQIW